MNKNIYIKFETIKEFIDQKKQFGNFLHESTYTPTEKIEFYDKWMKNTPFAKEMVLDRLKDTTLFSEELQAEFELEKINETVLDLAQNRLYKTQLQNLMYEAYSNWLQIPNIQNCIQYNRNGAEPKLKESVHSIGEAILENITEMIKGGYKEWKSNCIALCKQQLSLTNNLKPYKDRNAIFLAMQGRWIDKLDEKGNKILKLDKNKKPIPVLDSNGDPLLDEKGKKVYQTKKFKQFFEDNRWSTLLYANKNCDGIKPGSKPSTVINTLLRPILRVRHDEKITTINAPTKADLNKFKAKYLNSKKSLITFQAEKITEELLKIFPDKNKELNKTLNEFLKTKDQKTLALLCGLLAKNTDINVSLSSVQMGDVSYLVYNCEDVVNPPPNLELEKTKSLLEERRKNLVAVNPEAEALIAAFAKITPIYHDSTNGSNFYTPGRNEIHVAPREQFSSNDAYYSTIFHEMAHATGKVFGRNMTGMFGSKSYAEEEFNAEWSAIQMCANTGVLYDLQNHTSYIHGWGGALFDLKTKPTAKEDPEVLFNQWEEMANSEDGKKVFQRVFDNSAKVMELMNSVTKENFDIEKFKKRIEHNKEDIAIER